MTTNALASVLYGFTAAILILAAVSMIERLGFGRKKGK